MIRIGVTAGIGAGKTTVCKEFEKMKIPVYYSDYWAKWIMVNDERVKEQLIQLLGSDTYQTDGLLNRKYIANLIFNDTELEKKVQLILKEPFVNHLNEWCKTQEENMSDCFYALVESAIFFETNTTHHVDLILGIDAPLNMRISRAMKRDGAPENEIMRRVKLQNHDENMKSCDFVLNNTNKVDMRHQVNKFHHTFVKIAYLSYGISVQRGGARIR